MDFSKISRSVYVKPPLTEDDFKKGITKYGDNSWEISPMRIFKCVSNFFGWTQEFHAKKFLTQNKDRFTVAALRECHDKATEKVKAAVSVFLDPSDQTDVQHVADSLLKSIKEKNTALKNDLLESLSNSKDPSKVLENLRARNDQAWKEFQAEVVSAAKAFLEPSMKMTEEKKKQLNFLVRIMDADSVHVFLLHALQHGSIDKISFITPHEETLKKMVAVTHQQQNEQQQPIGHTNTVGIANALKAKIPELENNPSALLDTLNYLAPALNALPVDKLVGTGLLKAIMDTGDVKCIETIMKFECLKGFTKEQLEASISIEAIQFDSEVMNAVVGNMPNTEEGQKLLAGWKAAEEPITKKLVFTALNNRANQTLKGLGSLYPNVKKIDKLSLEDTTYLKNAVQGGDIKTVDSAINISIEVRQLAISRAKSPESILAILQFAPENQRNQLIESVLLRAVALGDSSIILNVFLVYSTIPSEYVEKAYKLASIRHDANANNAINLKDLLKGRVNKNERRKIDENMPSYKNNIKATVDNLFDAALITEIVKSTASCKAFCEMFPQMFALLTDAQRDAIADKPLLLKAIMENGDRECIQAIMKIPKLKTLDKDQLAAFIDLSAIQANNPGLIRDVVNNMPSTDGGKALLQAWTDGPNGVEQTPEETQFVFTTLAACANDILEELESLYSSIKEPNRTLNSDEIKYLKHARNGTIPSFVGQLANISLDVTRYAISLAKNADNVLAILQSACNNGSPSYTEEEKRKLIETALLRAVALGDSSTISRVLAQKWPSSYAIQENTLQKAYKLAKIRKDASSIASLSGKIDKDVKNQIDTITQSYQDDIKNNVMRLLDNQTLLAKIVESKELCADFCNMLPKMLPLLSSAQRKKFGQTLQGLEHMKNRKGFQRILQLFLSFFSSVKKNAAPEWLKILRSWENN